MKVSSGRGSRGITASQSDSERDLPSFPIYLAANVPTSDTHVLPTCVAPSIHPTFPAATALLATSVFHYHSTPSQQRLEAWDWERVGGYVWSTQVINASAMGTGERGKFERERERGPIPKRERPRERKRRFLLWAKESPLPYFIRFLARSRQTCFSNHRIAIAIPRSA